MSSLDATFEELRKVQLSEKHSALLSPLPLDFYSTYNRVLEASKPSATSEVSLEAVKLYSNSLAVLRDIASIRSHKILLKALRESRGQQAVPEGLAEEESHLYSQTISLLREFDKTVASTPLEGKPQKQITTVEILTDLPEFIFNNSPIGPFKQGERTELDNQIAQLLIRRGAAKESSIP